MPTQEQTCSGHMLVIFRTITAGIRRADARSEAGFTLIEMLVAAALSTIVFAAVLSALETSQHTQSRDSEWALVVQEGRAGLARMVREVRQAYSIRGATESSLDFYATIGGKDLEIYYACNVAESGTSYYQCVRLQTEVGKSLPALSTGAPIIKYVLNGTSADEKDSIFKRILPERDRARPGHDQARVARRRARSNWRAPRRSPTRSC